MRTAHNRIEVLHGPNFDVLERRDPEIYGGHPLNELERQIRGWADERGLNARCFQTNSEGEFIEHLHRLPELADAAIVNAGAWTHYSRAIADALELTRPACGRGPYLRRRIARGVAPRLGLRRARPGEGLGQGARRLPRGARAAGRRARRRRAMSAVQERQGRAPGGAGRRARGRSPPGHQPGQRPLPDRLRRHQRSLPLRARGAGLPDRFPLHRARDRGGRGVGGGDDLRRLVRGPRRTTARAGAASRTTT